jgi:hypothetical protein
MEKILTYTTPNVSINIRLTKRQIQALKKANLCPCDRDGEAYRSIGKPFRPGEPTWTDAQIQSFVSSRTLTQPPGVGR